MEAQETGTSTVGEVKKSKKAKDEAAPRKTRTNPVDALYGKHASAAVKIIPKAERKALLAAIKLASRDVSKVETRIATLQAKIAGVGDAKKLVESYREKIAGSIALLTNKIAPPASVTI